MERGVVVQAALIWIRAGVQEQLQDLVSVGSGRAAGDGPETRQGRNQRGEAGMVRVIRIRTAFEQEADERQGAV